MTGVLATAGSDLGQSLASVVVIGVSAMWLASRVKVPSVLLLLLGGVLAGAADVIDTEELLGDLLFPAVSLAVGILLFEGGLGLRLAELERHGRGPIVRLVTIGVVVTWAIGFVGVWGIVGLDRSASVLLAAILTVSGPTVVLPLLRFARVREPVNGILRWEGIFIDPIGATLAIVVLDAVIADQGTFDGAQRIVTTGAAGIAAGMLGAALLTVLLRFHLIPDNLHNPFTLAAVVGAFAGADLLRPEAGLFATTVMGVALANQRWAPTAHIRDFQEDLGQLILAGLFVVLGANIDLDLVGEVLPEAIALTLLLFFVARPAAVYASTVGSGLTFQERAFLTCLAPRGIVAASVSALFAIELANAGRPVEHLAPVTFVVIVGTVVLSAVAARVGAAKLRVARPAPRAVAFVGGPSWVVELATALVDRDIPALIVTNDPLEAVDASAHGVLTYTDRLDSADLELALDSVGVSTLLAVSRFQELNTLTIARALDTVGRANVFYLPPTHEDGDVSAAHNAVIARRPFHRECTQAEMTRLAAAGATVTAITAGTYDPQTLDGSLPLLRVTATGTPVVETGPTARPPAPGEVRFYLSSEPPSPDGTMPPSPDEEGNQ